MKMIFAIINYDDVDSTVNELNKRGFWVTKFSTSGGFFKNKNVTLAIGTNKERVPIAMEILKKEAGVHNIIQYSMPMSASRAGVNYNSVIPIETKTKGCTVFVLDVDKYEKF